MSNILEKIYRQHHVENRGEDFGIFVDDRGELFSSLIGEDKSILDIGCRDGLLSRSYLKNNHILGIDIDAHALRKAAERGVETLQIELNGEWNELREMSFDSVVASEIIEHLYFPKKVFDKIYGVLADGGLFLGSVPNAFRLTSRLRLLCGIKHGTPLSDPTHINHFSMLEIRTLLSGAGFCDIKFHILPSFRGAGLANYWPSLFAFMIVWSARKPPAR